MLRLRAHRAVIDGGLNCGRMSMSSHSPRSGQLLDVLTLKVQEEKNVWAEITYLVH